MLAVRLHLNALTGVISEDIQEPIGADILVLAKEAPGQISLPSPCADGWPADGCSRPFCFDPPSCATRIFGLLHARLGGDDPGIDLKATGTDDLMLAIQRLDWDNAGDDQQLASSPLYAEWLRPLLVSSIESLAHLKSHLAGFASPLRRC